MSSFLAHGREWLRGLILRLTHRWVPIWWRPRSRGCPTNHARSQAKSSLPSPDGWPRQWSQRHLGSTFRRGRLKTSANRSAPSATPPIRWYSPSYPADTTTTSATALTSQDRALVVTSAGPLLGV